MPTIATRNTMLVTVEPIPSPPWSVGWASRSPSEAPSGRVST